MGHSGASTASNACLIHCKHSLSLYPSHDRTGLVTNFLKCQQNACKMTAYYYQRVTVLFLATTLLLILCFCICVLTYIFSCRIP